MSQSPIAFTLKKMGTTFNFTIRSKNYQDEWIEEIESLIEKLEQSWSRFRTDSELSVLNHRRCLKSPSKFFIKAIDAAIKAHLETHGLFEPRILDALETIGYDRSFEKIQPHIQTTETHCSTDLPAILGDIEISNEQISIRSNSRIDLGGIGKCLALEEVSEWILRHDMDSTFLIEAGGDIVGRSSLDLPCWYIEIEDPNTCQPLSFWIRIANSAIATSSPSIRNWKNGGATKHHLIDPKTMDSSQSDLASVTVVGDVAHTCEVWSKSLFLMGKEAAIGFAEDNNIAAVFIDRRSGVTTSPAFDRYIEVRGESFSFANKADHLDLSSPMSSFIFIHFVH